MARRRLTLSYPSDTVQEPVIYRLVKDYDLVVNILKATIRPNQGGRLVLELTGNKAQMNAALTYLASIAVEAAPLVQEIKVDPERCQSCSICTAICPTGALSLDHETWEVTLDHEKCVMCESCVNVCPYRAIDIHF